MNDLRNRLSDSAHSFDVSEASSADLVRRARRRGQQSNAVKAAAVLTIAGVGVYGVTRLSDASDGVIVTGASANSAPAPSGGAAAGSTPIDQSGAGAADPFAGLPQTRAAEFIPGGYDWAAYRADSPEGLALRFDPDERYAISSGPGARDDTAVYKNTGGAWQPIVELGPVTTQARTNDTIFAIKWQNREPAAEITTVDLESETVGSVPYPDGLTVATQQVGRVTVHSSVTLAARGDLLALLTRTWHELDGTDLGLPNGWEVGEVSRGEVFASRANCETLSGDTSTTMFEFDDTATIAPGTYVATTVDPNANDIVSVAPDAGGPAVTGPAATSEPPLQRVPTASDTACMASFPIGELDVTEAERAAAATSPALWTFDGTDWTQIELPNVDADFFLEDPAVLGQAEWQMDEYGNEVWVGERYLAITDSNELQPLFGGNLLRNPLRYGLMPGDSKSDTFTKVNVPYVLTQQVGTDEWHATDLRTLGVDSEPGPVAVNAVDAVPLSGNGVFAQGDVMTGYPTEPTELTSDSGEYTLSFPGHRGEVDEFGEPVGVGHWTVTNNATGEQLNDVELSTMSGRVEILRNESETVASFNIDWKSVPALSYHNSWVLLMSDDGLRYRVVDRSTMSDAAGLSGYGLNSAFRGVERRGEQIVLRNDTSDPNTGEEVTMLIVGTPR